MSISNIRNSFTTIRYNNIYVVPPANNVFVLKGAVAPQFIPVDLGGGSTYMYRKYFIQLGQTCILLIELINITLNSNGISFTVTYDGVSIIDRISSFYLAASNAVVMTPTETNTQVTFSFDVATSNARLVYVIIGNRS